MGKKLVSKKSVGVKRVFDLDIAGDHNFIANGTVVHNCTEKGAQKFFEKAQPKSITDIAALTSIYRPGPLAADVDKIYNEAKANPDAVVYDHPALKEVLEETYGCLVGDTIVVTDDGDFTIQYIVENIAEFMGRTLPSVNLSTNEIEQDQIVAALNMGEQDTIILQTEQGSLQLTANHKVLTQRGMIPAGELTLDDVLFITNE